VCACDSLSLGLSVCPCARCGVGGEGAQADAGAIGSRGEVKDRAGSAGDRRSPGAALERPRGSGADGAGRGRTGPDGATGRSTYLGRCWQPDAS
jgi:hypothetical protein